MFGYSKRTKCPECGSDNTRALWPITYPEAAMNWIGLHRFICRECEAQFRRIRHRIWIVSFVGLILSLISVAAIIAILPLGIL